MLWSLLASNPSGETVQLGYKTLDGQKIAQLFFPWSEGQQHNMDGFADTGTPGKVVMFMPQAGLDKLGPVWWCIGASLRVWTYLRPSGWVTSLKFEWPGLRLPSNPRLGSVGPLPRSRQRGCSVTTQQLLAAA